MKKEEVASEELRRFVERLKTEGLPTAVSMEEAGQNLTDEQVRILGELYELGQKEKAVAREGEKPQQGDKWWQVRLEFRQVLQKAVLAGMIHLGIIQRSVVYYGAIPDPKESWKYFWGPGLYFCCFRCGDEIKVKTVSRSVHFKEMFLAGGGEVVQKQVPWCPLCEKEPPDSDIIEESVADTFKRENPVLVGMKRR